MAQLLSWLALAGARNSSGGPVSSGSIWFYEPGGGTTTATVYADVAGTVIASNPATLDAAGRAMVYVTSPVRVVVQDSTGADVSDYDQADVTRAETVQIDNAGWSDTYLGSVLTKIFTSTGGVDAQYQESTGATARTIKAKFSELSISVKDFGAQGDNLTIDTTAIQAAINRASSLGGGIVYFPPGTYKIDAALVGASNVVIVGAGSGATIIKQSSSTLGGLAFTSANGIGVRGLRVSTTTTSSGTGIAVTTASGMQISDVKVDGFDTAIGMTSVTDGTIYGNSNVSGNTTGVRMTSCTRVTTLGGQFYGVTTSLAVLSGNVLSVLGTQANPVSVDNASANVVLIGITGAMTFSGGTQPDQFFQYGNGVEGATITAATGTTSGAMDLALGTDFRINVTSGGAGTVTVPAFTNPPPTTRRNYVATLRLTNAAGGAVTWALNANFVLDGGAAPVGTNGTTSVVSFLWDGSSSKFRELTRSNTVT